MPAERPFQDSWRSTGTHRLVAETRQALTSGESVRETFAGPWARPAAGGDLEPPGTYSSLVTGFGSAPGCVEVGVVHEHRFAFYFWNKWARDRSRGARPALVTIDWHQDLGFPDEEEQRCLSALDQADDSEVALFAWSQLHPHNDGHILAAAYLGLIGDVYVLCKQDEPEDLSFSGPAGTSAVRVYHDVDHFLAAVMGLPAIILDMDLDYFTRSPDPCGGGENVSLVRPGEMDRLLDPVHGALAPLLPHVVGVTIAIEPEFCGGLSNAHRLFRRVNETLFGGTLLSERARWRSPGS